MSARILLVEDDALLADGIKEGLLDAGFTVDWVSNGQHAVAALDIEQSFDAAILDLGLPGFDGLQVLEQWRMSHHAIPVLILTARDTVQDRIFGLDSGADDYLVKPFSLGELAARLRVLVRRNAKVSTHVLEHGAIQLDPGNQHVTLNGVPVSLTARQYQLLWLLMRSYPHLLSREQIEQRIYGWDGGNESNSLDVHFSQLRKKIGEHAIVNMRGLGWRMADKA